MSFTGTITTHESGAYHVFEWRIQGFSTLRKTDGAQYWSPTFSFGGERWRLEIYPNGSRAWWSSKHVDLWLCKYPSGRSIKMSVSLSLKTAEGERHKEEHATKDFCDDGDNWVHRFNRLVPRAELTALRSDLLPDDVLTVVCTMKGRSSAGSEVCTQTEKNALKQVSAQTEKQEVRQACTQTQKQNFRDASTQTVGERYYNCREKLLMALCIASIIIAVVTGCALAYFKTPLSFSHPGREAVKKIETSEMNNTINGSELDGSVSNEIEDTDIKQTEGVKKAADVTLTTELNAELNKTNQSEIAKSVTPEANQADSTETGDSEDASKIQTSVNNRSDVVESNEYEASDSNDTSATDIKEDGDINKTLAAEMNEIDNSEIAASDISETSATNQADSAEKDESDHNLPKDHDKQLVLCAAAIIILAIAIACVYHYFKTSLSATHAYGEETQTISEEDDAIIEGDVSEEAETDESEASDSNTCMSKTEGPEDNLEQNSENTSMELCTQMAEENENSKRICMNTSTQTGEENENSKRVCMNTSTQTGEENEERDWMTDVLDFLKAGNGIDVTFEVETPNGHVEFFAHKLILAMKSPFFADEFYGEGKSDAHLVIPLKGINPKAFMEMLRYCYDNKPRMRTIEEACVLFKVASDFKILNLQKLCHAFIRDAKVDS